MRRRATKSPLPENFSVRGRSAPIPPRGPVKPRRPLTAGKDRHPTLTCKNLMIPKHDIRGLLTWNRADAERYFERSKAEQYIRPWREVAGELAESGSALVNELREGRRPCPLVLSLFLEACTSYDRIKRKEVA